MVDEIASFIRARDPSILAWNRPRINPAIRTDLYAKYSENESSVSSLNTEEEENADHLEVHLRIKPSKNINSLYHFDEHVLTCHVPSGSQVLRNVQEGSKVTKTFSFSKIYGPESTQTEIFNDCIKKKVLGFINGRNSTIFTYGTSGSGKTFTILGTSENPGIIPRSLEYLFRTIPSVSDIPKVKPTQSGDVTVLDNTACANERKARNKILNISSASIDRSLHIQTYKLMQQRLSAEPNATINECSDVSIGVWVSFAEVYNEYVYDLLQPDPGRGRQRPKLRLAQDNKGNTYVKDLINISVSSGLEAYEILQYGMHNLNYAPTSLNSHSSRSHCIFTIKLVQLSADYKAQISYFNFCDLAGSERVKNTRNVGDRLKESNNINTSLHVFGKCIKSIRESQKNQDTRRIPFRESKLTRLFQRALSGHESIAMIVNINASRELFDETQHVLNFSAVAKDISIEKETRQEIVSANRRFSHYIKSQSTVLPSVDENESSEIDILREQVLTLSLELEQQRQAFAEREFSIRKEIVTAFQQRNKEMTEKWNQRNDEERNKIIALYEFRIEKLTEFYEKEKSKEIKRQRVSEVIDLDSTKNDEIEDLKHELEIKNLEINKMKNSLEEYQNRSNTLQAEKTQIDFKLSTLESEMKLDKNKLKEMSEENLLLKKENIKLKQVISDAEAELKLIESEKHELQKDIEEKLLENIQLKEEVTNLNEVISQYSEKIEQQEEKLENLEDIEMEENNKENVSNISNQI